MALRGDSSRQHPRRARHRRQRLRRADPAVRHRRSRARPRLRRSSAKPIANRCRIIATTFCSPKNSSPSTPRAHRVRHRRHAHPAPSTTPPAANSSPNSNSPRCSRNSPRRRQHRIDYNLIRRTHAPSKPQPSTRPHASTVRLRARCNAAAHRRSREPSPKPRATAAGEPLSLLDVARCRRREEDPSHRLGVSVEADDRVAPSAHARPSRAARRRHAPQARPRPQAARCTHCIGAGHRVARPRSTTPCCSLLRARIQPIALAERWPTSPTRLANAAAIVRSRRPRLPITQCARAGLRAHAEERQRHQHLHRHGPAARPRSLRMEQAGVRIDTARPSAMSTRLAVEMDTLAERIYELAGDRFNINSPKQLGDVLFNKMDLPKPMKYGKGKVISTAQDVLEELAEQHPVPRSSSSTASSPSSAPPTSTRCLSSSTPKAACTPPSTVGTATGRLSSTNPNLQNIPVRTALGREIRAAFIPAPGTPAFRRLLADRAAPDGPLQRRPAAAARLPDRPGHPHPHRHRSLRHPRRQLDKETRNRAKAVNFGIVYGISPFGLAAQLGIPQARSPHLHRPLLRALPRRQALHRQDPRNHAPRQARPHLLRPRPPHSRHRDAQPQHARIRRAHRHQHAAAGHRRRPHQAGHAPHRPPSPSAISRPA